MNASAGDEVVFECESKTKPIWYKGENSLPISRKHTLAFESVQTKHQGYYICKGQYDNNEYFYAKVHLSVGKNCIIFKNKVITD